MLGQARDLLATPANPDDPEARVHLFDENGGDDRPARADPAADVHDEEVRSAAGRREERRLHGSDDAVLGLDHEASAAGEQRARVVGIEHFPPTVDGARERPVSAA